MSQYSFDEDEHELDKAAWHNRKQERAGQDTHAMQAVLEAWCMNQGVESAICKVLQFRERTDTEKRQAHRNQKYTLRGVEHGGCGISFWVTPYSLSLPAQRLIAKCIKSKRHAADLRAPCEEFLSLVMQQQTGKLPADRDALWAWITERSYSELDQVQMKARFFGSGEEA